MTLHVLGARQPSTNLCERVLAKYQKRILRDRELSRKTGREVGFIDCVNKASSCVGDACSIGTEVLNKAFRGCASPQYLVHTHPYQKEDKDAQLRATVRQHAQWPSYPDMRTSYRISLPVCAVSAVKGNYKMACVDMRAKVAAIGMETVEKAFPDLGGMNQRKSLLAVGHGHENLGTCVVDIRKKVK